MSCTTNKINKLISKKFNNKKINRIRRCLLCSAVGSKILDEDSSNILCQEMEDKGEIISCGDDGLPYLSQLDKNDTELFCEALQIEMGEYLQKFKPTFCSTKCFQTVARITTIYLELNKLVDEIVVGILESMSHKNKKYNKNLTDIENIFEKKICQKWSDKYAEFDFATKVETNLESNTFHHSSPKYLDKAQQETTKLGTRNTNCENTYDIVQQMREIGLEQIINKKTPGHGGNEQICPIQNKKIKIQTSKKLNHKSQTLNLSMKNTNKTVSSTPTAYKCSICKESFSNKKNFHAHMRREHHENKTKCLICGIIFRTKEFYSIHLEHLHTVLTQDYNIINKNERYECKYCEKKFSNVSSLKTHQHSHIRKKPSACPNCQKILLNDVDFYYHKKIHDGSFNCDECGEEFNNHENLITHQRQHNINNGCVVHTCDICNNTFAKLFNLEEHVKVHTSINNSKFFTCELCGECFGIKYYLHRHLAVQHRVPEYLSRFNSLCHLCGKDFALKKCMLVHLKTHTNDQRFTCKDCPEQFISRHALKQHQASLHEGVLNIFKCNYCQETFTFLIASRKHMVEVHPEHTISTPFPCKVCFRTFAVLPLLEDHFKCHAKLTCKVCGKACGSKRRLEMHETVHTGELKYSCDICGKGFRHDNNVQSHKKEQHNNGQRPWICIHCPTKSYKRKEHLRFHLQREHGEDLEIRKKKKTIADQGVISDTSHKVQSSFPSTTMKGIDSSIGATDGIINVEQPVRMISTNDTVEFIEVVEVVFPN